MSRPTMPRSFAVLPLALLLAAVARPATAASAPDPHVLYEKRCARCHDPHAGPFARARLKVETGKVLIRKSGQEVGPFMTDHAKLKLAQPEIDALVEQFRSIVQRGGIYKEKCASCHGTALKLAREQLKLADGKVVSKRTGKDIAAFLPTHEFLSNDAQRAVVMEMLRSQLQKK